VLRLEPGQPEAHWILARLARQRGHYKSEQEHLRILLGSVGPATADRAAAARSRLDQLEDERRLADLKHLRGPLELLRFDAEHFYVEVDSDLDAASSRYAADALANLEDARRDVSAQLGVAPEEPLGVVFYARAAYLRAHRHRFSFATVGFFDGRIHVSSPAHPSGELRSLLYHEYTHALFREQTGGDRPYWLNEGLAELVERRARQQPTSTRSERASLRTRIAAGDWLSLRRLAPSFGGLSDEDARAAYLQAIVTAEWLERNSQPQSRARLLRRLGEGMSIDQALFELCGLDTDGLDRAVRQRVQSEFPIMGAR
jgi:hypothetical protein